MAEYNFVGDCEVLLSSLVASCLFYNKPTSKQTKKQTNKTPAQLQIPCILCVYKLQFAINSRKLCLVSFLFTRLLQVTFSKYFKICSHYKKITHPLYDNSLFFSLFIPMLHSMFGSYLTTQQHASVSQGQIC